MYHLRLVVSAALPTRVLNSLGVYIHPNPTIHQLHSMLRICHSMGRGGRYILHMYGENLSTYAQQDLHLNLDEGIYSPPARV